MIVVTCRLPVLYSTYLGTLPVESCAWVHLCFFFTLGGRFLKKTLAVPFIFERRFFTPRAGEGRKPLAMSFEFRHIFERRM